jgi:hypothetical protein
MTDGKIYLGNVLVKDSGSVSAPPTVYSITTSQNWSPAPGEKWAIVEGIAAGGGANARYSGNGIQGGGAGGEYGLIILDLSTVTAPVSVTIGAGGLGGQSNPSQPATAGGNTLFGTLLTVHGGGAAGGLGGGVPGSLQNSWQFNLGTLGGSSAGSNKANAGSSDLGGGAGGSCDTTAGGTTYAAGLGGLAAAARGLLKAGNGSVAANGQIPGGGAGAVMVGVPDPGRAGGRGEVRITAFH